MSKIVRYPKRMAGYFCIATDSTICIATDAAIGFAISWVLKYNLKAYGAQEEQRKSEDDDEGYKKGSVR